MLRASRVVASLSVALCTAGAFTSCDTEPGSAIDFDMKFPEGVLDKATSVKLQVFDATGITCDATTGAPSSVPTKVSKYDLAKTDCGSATWCTSVTLDQDDSTKMFSVQASDSSGLLAQGCATAKIDQDPLSVSIKVVRYVAPACCGDGLLQPGELCDNKMSTGTQCTAITEDEICASDCTTKEIAVDRAPGGPTPAVGTRSEVALAFAGGNSSLNNGLRAAFLDSSTASPDIDIRFLTADLDAITSPALLAGPLRIPVSCGNPSGPGEARRQDTPAIAGVGSSVLVTYLSDEKAPGQFNVFLTVVGPSGCADNGPVQVNTVANGATDPQIAAGPNGGALITWVQGGSVNGELWDATNGLTGTPFVIATGDTAHVAGGPTGYVVAYHGNEAADPDGVYLRTVSGTGVVGSSVSVNSKTTGTQDQPDVAVTSDGRSMVVFRSSADIFMQRFGADLKPVSGDQDDPFETTMDGQLSLPTVAVGNTASNGDFFVAGWQSDSGNVYGRLAGGSMGFLFNAIDGQNSDFLVNIKGETGQRENPKVVSGGNGYIVFGWDDKLASNPGVFIRRFPLPN